MIKVVLPHVMASGQREGWWFHITGLAKGYRQKSFDGFAKFEGARLSSGECELPPLAVVLLVRPEKSQREDARVADLFQVHPASGDLVGVAYGFDWSAGLPYEALQLSVVGALQVRQNFEDMAKKIAGVTSGWLGQRVASGTRSALAAELSSTIAACVPGAVDVVVCADRARGVLEVSFSIPGGDKERHIDCAVPTYDGQGDPDFFFVRVVVPRDYVDVEEDEDDGADGAPHHHDAARRAACHAGLDVTKGVPVYDSEAGWNELLSMFEWSTATRCDLEGQTL